VIRKRASRVDGIPSAIGAISRMAYAYAERSGVDLDPLLKKAGLGRLQFESPQARLLVGQQIKFLNLVADALSDDLLGFNLAQATEPRELGLLYYVIASSGTLSDALQRVARYSSIVNEGIALTFFHGKHVGLTVKYVGVTRYHDRHQIEYWMTMLLRMCRQLSGRRLVPDRVRFAHRRQSSGELAKFFGTDIEYGAAADGIAFEPDAGDLPVISADSYLNKLLVQYCEDALAHRSRRRGGVRSAVENAIVPLLPHARANAAEVARALGMSQRTLARRLDQEGANFSDVRETLRAELANRYLADENLSVSQIAWLLGYRDVGAFSHAFKRWTGKTPRAVRVRAA
jgi:AraC-like DNA-binding protein